MRHFEEKALIACLLRKEKVENTFRIEFGSKLGSKKGKSTKETKVDQVHMTSVTQFEVAAIEEPNT